MRSARRLGRPGGQNVNPSPPDGIKQCGQRIRVHLWPTVVKIFKMSSYHLDHLQYLETEAIHIMREVAAEFERPALLFSGGKDSICLLRLAEKAFRPSDIPMPFLNVETGHEFPELITFRDRRAKERFFSFRDSFGQWDPKNQRPEIWNLYNARVNPGENMRVFPLSNWTEMDVWEYIKKEKLQVPTIYFSHERDCFRKGCQWLPVPPPHTDATKPDPYAGARPKPTEPIKKLIVRVRTIADMISTGMIESPADSVDDIIGEVSAARVTERGTRADDKASEAAMEDRKKAGYF